MKQTLILLLAMSLTACSGSSQNIDKAKLDAYFDTLANNNRFMGSVAISQNNKLIYTKSVGFANIEQGVKADKNSKYRIGSISKTFTAVLVLKAIEENKLSLNQTIKTFFPAIENAGEITIAHLLWHRSGIHSFTDDISDPDWATKPKTKQEMIDIISKVGSDFEPDTKASYSNSNFVLLTFILEDIYKQSYAKILKEKIAKPLGLKNTYLGKKIDIKDNECDSYMYIDSWEVKSEADMSIPLGAGGIVSTPTDLMLFSQALFNGKLISINSLTQMKTVKDHFGMGLFQMPFYDQIGFGHNGAIDGFASLFAYFPDSKISFAYTANGINYNGNDIAIVILSAAYNKPFEIPKFTTYDVTDEELDKYLGVYSTEQLPLKMTITKANGKLFGQGTAQPSFPLEATGKDEFKFELVGVVLEFNPADRTMVLKQNGGIFNFVREE